MHGKLEPSILRADQDAAFRQAREARNRYLDTKAQIDLLKLKLKQLKLELEQAEAEMDSAFFPSETPLLGWKEEAEADGY